MTNKTIKTIQRWIAEIDYDSITRLINRALEAIRGDEQRAANLTAEGGLVKIRSRKGRMLVIGDVHGDLETLIKILKNEDAIEKLEQGDMYIVFLGDYIDRGHESLEVMALVLNLKCSYPDKVVLLRGNHEGPDDLIAHPHTFPYELALKFGGKAQSLYLKFRKLFNAMHHAAMTSNGIIMLHGGVPTEAESIDDVIRARELHPEKPHLTEILWNDPDESGVKGAYPSPRGAGKMFGIDCTEKFLKIVNGKILVRGHEAALNGYKISHEGRIVTLFSRIGPPYWNLKAAYIVFDLEDEAIRVRDSIKLIE